MVKIEKLSLQGFKSFANKTLLPFPSGFNVISGPNGSGKSNLVDALCFVLGIRSAKTIRADKLEQLIFNGGKKRQALPYAAVSLYVNNEDGEIQGEEKDIKITRKVNKKGVSIYKLNGRTVNRRKIIDILSNARIHADGHNIIMQGDVINLIKKNPVERREIIDEISGIAEFEDKKTKAENELEKVDVKLNEAKIILNEKMNTLKNLEKDRKLAKEYKTLQEDLKTVSGSIIKIRLDKGEKGSSKINEELEKNEKKFKEIDEKFQELNSELEKKQKEKDEIASKVFKRDKNINEKHKLSMEISKRSNKVEGEVKEIQGIDDWINQLSEESIAAKKLKARKGVHGTVGELFTTDSKYQSAIEVALGGRLNDLVVETDQVAEDCINFLKREKIGRATLLPLNKIKFKEVGKAKDSGIINFAINLVKYASAYEPAMRYAFGDTVVVKDLKIARKLIGKYRMVTLDGELIQKSGAMSGGFRKKSNMQKIAECRKKKKLIEGEIETLRKEIEELELKLKEFEKPEEEAESEEYRKLSEEIEKIREERQKFYDQRMSFQSKISDLQIKKTRIETEMNGLKMEFEEFKDLKSFLEESIETLQKQKKNIVEKLRRIGAVNLKAIQDFDSMKIWCDDLSEKVERIEKEKMAVLDMADRIERRRKEAFMKTFEVVNKNFGSIFKDLAGGLAGLELEDSNDIRTGLIIKAQPEGKGALSLDSMSGGEKTITALAFLFAVQMYKPAPFYILDEIDAALDKINSKKIGELLQKQSKNAQFIVITHNDVTIKMADQVYGVSMENGVSKVMAIRLPVN